MRYLPKITMLITLAIFSSSLYATDVVTGKKLYQANCSQCHGLEGDGFGVNSYDMSIAPRDHTDKDEMSARTDEDLFKSIKLGGKSVNKSILMPPWEGVLSDEEIHLIVGHLRQLCCKGK
jgi:cytochrome c oxidase cbb3-type subunit 3